MEKFTNITTNTNEEAIRKGRRVPDGAVNLAWVKSPKLSPGNNSVVIDTSQTISENTQSQPGTCKLYYANALGILEDEFGNQLVQDEFPVISDVFSVDEDFLAVPGSEYTAESALPYVHVSRYFHVDFPDLTIGSSDLKSYDSNNLKVIDSRGQHYTNEDGSPRYRIMITPVFTEPNPDNPSLSGVYRVYAFIDEGMNEDLYLAYNKVEVNIDNEIHTQDINHTEILNPQPYFYYKPEESDVVDGDNRNKKWYSTKLASLKEQIIGLPQANDVEGYRVYVPRKAIPDPRIFQLFRWRVSCNFTQQYKIEEENTDPGFIRCGVIKTHNVKARAPYVFYNIERSNYNATGVSFINPIQEDTPDDAAPLKTERAYWEVDFDTITYDELNQFDILVWTPASSEFDFTPYLNKIDFFTKTLGRTLIIDTDNHAVATGLGLSFSKAIIPNTGAPKGTAGFSGHAKGLTTEPYDTNHIFFDANTQLGGWDFNSGSGNLLEYNSFEEEWDGVSANHIDVFDSDGNAVSIPIDEIIVGWEQHDEDFSCAVQRTTTRSYDGVASCVMYNSDDADQGNDYIFVTKSALAPKTTYIFSAYCWVEEFVDGALWNRGLFAARRGPWKNYGSTKINATHPTGQWVRHELKFKTDDDPGVTELRLYSPQGTVYWDAVQLEVAVKPKQDIVIDSSFEEPGITFNRSSESDPNEWRLNDIHNSVTATQNTKKFQDKTASVKLVNTEGKRDTYIHKLFNDIKPETKYIASAWVYVKDIEDGALFNRGLYVASTDASAQKYAATKIKKDWSKKGNWVKQEVTFTTGLSPNSIEVRLYAPEGTVFWDTVRFEELTDDTYDARLYVLSSNLGHPRATKFSASSTMDNDFLSITPYRKGVYGNGYVQRLADEGSYDIILQAESGQGAIKPLVVGSFTATGGCLIVSTTSIVATCSRLFSHVTGRKIYANNSTTVVDDDDYDKYINSSSIEGAMKFMFNICLYALSNTLLDEGTERTYSTNWKTFTTWHSSWVINPENYVLSEQEKTLNDFVILPRDVTDPVPIWQRRLSAKTVKELIDQELTEEQAATVRGAVREYAIEVTNELVETTSTLDDNTLPHAWTEAYTPKFEVPSDLGPFIVKDEQTQGNYEAAQFTQKEYPAKPYGVQVSVRYKSSEDHLEPQTVNWQATGNGDYSRVSRNNTILRWSTHGGPNIFYRGDEKFNEGTPLPNSILTKQFAQYHSAGVHTTFPNYGRTSTLRLGSHGEEVLFVQDALNRFAFWGIFEISNALELNGIYDSKTKAAVLSFQQSRNAITQDGNVGLETWFLIGNQILHLGALIGNTNSSDYTRFFRDPAQYMALQNISDYDKVFLKRSMLEGGPSIVSETIAMRFDDTYSIYGITLNPYVPGDVKTMLWRSADVIHSNINYPNLYHILQRYNPDNAKVKDLNRRVVSSEKEFLRFGPYTGDTIIVNIAQDRSSGLGTSKVLGVRELYAHARRISSRIDPVLVNDFGTVTVFPRQDLYVKAKISALALIVEGYTEGSVPTGKVGNVRWYDVSSDNSNVLVSITPKGKIRFRCKVVDQAIDTNFVDGPEIPSGDTYYGMTNTGIIYRYPETGFVSKSEGIKLLCNNDGTPYGFPDLPTGIGPNEAQQHYATLTIQNINNDPSVMAGFYDISKQEFIFNKDGTSELSYIDYVSRGVGNVYVAVMSSYEVDNKVTLPPATDAPLIPSRWAMPVYGVCTSGKSKIGLEPIPPDLGATELWSVPVRTGRFNKSIYLKPRNEVSLTSFLDEWLSDYQGVTVKAFYSIPEANKAAWSRIYGRPNMDINGEHPIIEADNILRILRPPILMVQQPTIIPSKADPLTPVFSVYTRASVTDSWTIMPYTNIKDFNVSTGTIYLKEPLDSTDPYLVKVNYTSARNAYPYKLANINPYTPYARENFIGHPIYIYILPEFVKDSNDNIIEDSIRTSTLRLTTDPTIFDDTNTLYNPLALQLGVVYSTTALDVSDLSMMDTRRRGGGAKEGYNKQELERLVKESMYFWDVNYGAGMSYQKGGFVIIRLPEELKEDFPNEADIIEIIERNITAGVEYIIEDSQGRAWSSV